MIKLRDIEVTAEEEAIIIKKVADAIFLRRMDFAAVYLLTILRPLARIGGQMGLMFLTPHLLLFGENFKMDGEKLIEIFQNQNNVEKLILMLEKMGEEEDIKKNKKNQLEDSKKRVGGVTYHSNLYAQVKVKCK